LLKGIQLDPGVAGGVGGLDGSSIRFVPMGPYYHYPFSDKYLIGIFSLEAGKIVLSPPS
jgi:hypothetical protein